MKNLRFLLFIGLVLIVSCKSKNIVKKEDSQKEVNYIPYYLKVYEADSLYQTNNFEKCYKILDSLFKIYKPINTEEYAEYGIYLNSAVMTGNLKDFGDKVKFGFLNFGNIKTLHRNRALMYDTVKKASNLNPEEIKLLKTQYYNNLNLDLRKRLLEMLDDDQEVRLENHSVEEILAVDEKNRIKMNEIFKLYDFPKRELVGSINAYDMPDGKNLYLDILFLHQSDSVIKRYLPKLLTGVKKGYCDPKVYSQVYDRMMMDETGKQYFGSYTCDSNGEVCPLINPEKIDSIRKSIGLYHIKYHPWRLKQFLGDK